MENEPLKEIIKGFLGEYKNMTVATCVKDVPWAATLFFAYDEALNLYFVSDSRTRHAQDMAANAKAAVVINPNNQEHGKIRGLQMEGTAKMLHGADMISAFAIYMKRHPVIKNLVSSAEKLISGNVRIYQIQPTRIYFIDEARFGKGGRQEITLNG
ncbi:MAG: pyridoxamine 5'-phosphate oxidase family protein [Patescibacteria group bacterium]